MKSLQPTSNSDDVFNFENLKVYQKALDLIDRVYDQSRNFPNNEMFSLTIQFRRAANSIALNIAEGASGTKKEFAYFLKVARRSVRECVVCNTIASRRKYITAKDAQSSGIKLIEFSKMISGLLNSL